MRGKEPEGTSRLRLASGSTARNTPKQASELIHPPRGLLHFLCIHGCGSHDFVGLAGTKKGHPSAFPGVAGAVYVKVGRVY